MPTDYTERPTSRLTTLVMLSAGVDSTYTLYKLLRETDDEILAHHIHLINFEGRAQVEAERSRAIVAWLKSNVREFEYSESAIDHSIMRWFGYDTFACGFEAGIVANSYRMATGRHLDRFVHGFCTDESAQVNWHARALVQSCCAANCFPFQAPEFWHLPAVSKAEEVAYLPKQLLDLVWTCRRPVKGAAGFSECGECPTCQTMNKIRVSRRKEQQAPQ